MALLAIGSTAGCSGDDDGTSEQSPLGLGDEGVGTCLQFDDDVTEIVPSLPVVDCEVEHSHEIYTVAVVPESEYPVYPGFEELERLAQRVCLEAFEGYVGTNPFDSALFHTWMVPTLDGWNDRQQPDREILCILGSRDNEPLRGSMRQSQR